MLQKPKKKLLAWADSAAAGTGFGIVSKHVLGALHATGEWDIHHLAINAQGDFVAEEKVPWKMVPAKLLDQSDPHGMKMFGRSLVKADYDAVWICNDLYVTKEVIEMVKDIKSKKREKFPHFVYYYPVDCHAPSDGSMMVDFAETPVCYTDHGRVETLLTLPHVEHKLHQIPHGVNSAVFHPLPAEDVINYRRQYMGAGEDTFVVVNVNRNSTRKQVQYAILAFKEFKKKVPNSIMYLHTAVRDQGGDLIKAIEDAGLSTKHDIIFPMNYSPGNPVSEEMLNRLYNCGDCFLTTHLGEGWGLTITEAMAAGVPVVAPDNTSMPQQLGGDSERGYIYPCKDLVGAMMQAFQDGPKRENPKVQAARKWAVQHDWKEVTKAWVELFSKLKPRKVTAGTEMTMEVL